MWHCWGERHQHALVIRREVTLSSLITSGHVFPVHWGRHTPTDRHATDCSMHALPHADAGTPWQHAHGLTTAWTFWNVVEASMWGTSRHTLLTFPRPHPAVQLQHHLHNFPTLSDEGNSRPGPTTPSPSSSSSLSSSIPSSSLSLSHLWLLTLGSSSPPPHAPRHICLCVRRELLFSFPASRPLYSVVS